MELGIPSLNINLWNSYQFNLYLTTIIEQVGPSQQQYTDLFSWFITHSIRYISRIVSFSIYNLISYLHA